MTTTQNPDDKLLDVHSLAVRLGVRVRYIRRLIAERRIPYIKLGHFIRFDPDEIDEWVNQSRIHPTWPPSPRDTTSR